MVLIYNLKRTILGEGDLEAGHHELQLLHALPLLAAGPLDEGLPEGLPRLAAPRPPAIHSKLER